MMNKVINLTIDGKKCSGHFGETILEVARRNSIYIPTMCYLTKTLPIASCRICSVKVEGVDGFILSCQEKAVDGAVIQTNDRELYQERQNIMKLYNVNHPLECGVCDQSGECDLQNKTMEFGLDGQKFTTQDMPRPVQNWGHVSFDPSLCIMCEKCVRVSTEITGDEALKVKFGGYSSTIENVKQEANFATLGEAAAVCPVGALVDTKFKYSSNAWELSKIPSACPHCGVAHDITYEVKKGKIFRTSNQAEFSTMCSASRYGFDFANENVTKDKEAFNLAVEKFKTAKSIVFSKEISNEEAFMFQLLKEKMGIKLISPEARAYQKFMRAYSSITGKQLNTGTLEQLSKSRAIMVLGTRVNDDAPLVKFHINMASKWHRARVTYLHPIEDASIKNIVTQYITYDVGNEEAVTSSLISYLLKDIEGIDIDVDLDAISSEDLELLRKSHIKKVGFSLVVGSDLYAHPQAGNIAKMIALVEKHTDINVVVVPPAGNAMGVSLICDLDDEVESPSVGYNAKGDFTLSSFGGGDLDVPALNQQEGTLTSMSKRVVPMNVAVEYGGYVLNDIMKALGFGAEYTIDYTKMLPNEKGFSTVEFDDLPDYFDMQGVEHRGYMLKEVALQTNGAVEKLSSVEKLSGTIVYNCDPQEHFSPLTAQSDNLTSESPLLGSEAFAQEHGLTDGDTVCYTIDGIKFERVFKIDTSMKGTVALNPTFDMGLSTALLSSYRFSQVDLEKVGS